MQARDLMTTNVLCVAPDTPVQRVAQLLIEHAISAVPVVENGIPIGMISETDLVARSSAAPGQRAHWFTGVLAGQHSHRDFDPAHAGGRTARDIMSAPLITTTENTEAGDVVQLMMTHRIKRLPVVRGGKIVGLISRADLLRAIADALRGNASQATQPSSLANGFLAIDKVFNGSAKGHTSEAVAAAGAEPVLSAKEFRSAVSEFKHHAALEKAEVKRIAEERHKHDIDIVLGTHISEDWWRQMLLAARRAADNGEPEYQALRIPREACSDSGRMINMGEAGWASTLRGEAAELWLRWSKELQPRGFRLTARTLEYPDGIPGDIGIFIVWGGRQGGQGAG